MPRFDLNTLKQLLKSPNAPLALAGVLFAGSVIVAIVMLVGGGDDDPVEVVSIPDPQELEELLEPQLPAEDTVPDGTDPIGDLIASLPEERTTPKDEASTTLPPVPETADHQTWKQNSVAATSDKGPFIAIVIDDVGLNTQRTNELVALPAPVTLAFLPYAENLVGQTRSAREAGHELMVHMPMQPTDVSADPGPKALVVGLSDRELTDRIAWNLERFDGFVGFNNHMGSRFTADERGMAFVMAEAKARGLLFLDSRTTARTRGRELAERYGVPVLERDIFLDNEIDESAIRAQLVKAAGLAQERGAVIVIGHPHKATIKVLREWLADTGGIVPVPLSALVHAGHSPVVAGEANGSYSDKSGY